MSVRFARPRTGDVVTVPDVLEEKYDADPRWERVPAPSALDDMKIEELKAYAKEHDIDLGGATKKDDIRAAIDAHPAGD